MVPNSRERTRCELCRRPIFFAVTKGGARQPLDVKPDPLGSVAAYRSAPGAWWCRSVLGADADAAPAHPLEERFQPHAATCPSLKARRSGVQEALPDGTDGGKPPLPRNVIVFPVRRRR